MGLLCVPDLVEVARMTGDHAFLTVPGKDRGYAMPGLQKEGVLVSWWLANDPMFADTAFDGRGKGEGNKTCLPWISAVGCYAH